MKKICCKNCATEYEVELCANFMTFCPKCNSYNFMECEYGYGPVVPCEIYHGGNVVGIISYVDSDRVYMFDSDELNIHKVLNSRYLQVLEEVIDIVAELL